MQPLTSVFALSDRFAAKADPTLLNTAPTPARPITPEEMLVAHPLDDSPFFHGTIADLRPGDFLTAGRPSNFRPELVMKHVYFTATVQIAGLAAEIAAEFSKAGSAPRVYSVEPTEAFKDDPNVTDKRFPGNPTRSYRSRAPLRVLHEVTTWTRLAPEELQAWTERLTLLLVHEGAEIIN